MRPTPAAAGTVGVLTFTPFCCEVMLMKRMEIILLPVIGLILMCSPCAYAAAVKVQNSKHNLSSMGTSNIKASSSGGTSEICVFCHTPHAGNNNAPLWNRGGSVASYLTYTSDVLMGLTYYQAEDPSNPASAGYAVHVKSRLCLSCHDGTIALGHLVNLPYDPSTGQKLSSDVRMVNANADGTMPASSAGYIGTDLQDDHPVAIPHDNSRDQELRATIQGTAISLYYLGGGNVQKTNVSGSTNYVECTSCHNAHDNQYGNFLVQSNSGSALCIACHNKQTTGANPAHDSSTALYNFDGSSPTTQVRDVKCMNCHYSHKAGVNPAFPTTAISAPYGRYLLSFQEEGACFNTTNRWNRAVSVCHGTGSTTKNIQTLENSASTRHGTSSFSGKHQATEGRSANWINSGGALNNWHVECQDCHNPHVDGNTDHSAPGNTVAAASPLYGTGGVSAPTSYPLWPGPSSGSGYTYREPYGVINLANTSVQYEYEICFKCHTDFGFGTTNIPNSPVLGAAMTNQAMEFNPSNTGGRHPVIQATGRTVGRLLANPGLAWGAIGTNTMYCSDCHTQNSTIGAAASIPMGPHGSSNKAILRNDFTDTFGTRAGGLAQKQPANDLCFNCHDPAWYLTNNNTQVVTLGAGQQTGFYYTGSNYNLHTLHAYRAQTPVNPLRNPWPYRCVNCHTKITHGLPGPTKAMVLYQNLYPTVPAVYFVSANTATAKLISYTPGTGYTQASCNNVAGCHTN